MQADHAELITRVAARDRDAFRQLFELYAPRIKSYLTRTVRDPVRADELTQEVMLRVWRKADRFDPARGEVSTWIFVMARSVMIDAIRRASRPAPSEDDAAFVPAEPPAPDTAAEAARRRRTLHAAMCTLPQEQAQVLRSAYFEGKSLRDIADEQRVSLGTIKSRSRLALGRLRASLTLEPAL